MVPYDSKLRIKSNWNSCHISLQLGSYPLPLPQQNYAYSWVGVSTFFGAMPPKRFEEVWKTLPCHKNIQWWLRANRIWTSNLSLLEQQEYYIRFTHLNFGIAPPGVQPQLLVDLLLYEYSFSYQQNGIREAKGYEFSIIQRATQNMKQRVQPITPLF